MTNTFSPASSFAFNNGYLKRFHINDLLEKYIQKPVVMLIAGAGYGKTQTVYMFLQEYKAVTSWLQLTMLDNLGTRFWENLVSAISPRSEKLASNLEGLGFPETTTKFDMFLSYVLEDMNADKKYVIVYDDFHLIHEKKTLQFIEKFINAGIPNLSFILISRSESEINIAGLLAKNLISVINENEMCFSKSEMIDYYEMQEVSISPQLISRIYNNTEGWIMAIRLIELSIKKGVPHEEYAITAMKLNIYKLMDSEIYSYLSSDIQTFLTKLSLFDSLPSELVEELASDNRALTNTLLQVNSFIRFDSFSNMYCIHHLFLDFLRQKQDILTQDDKRSCYQKAADWYASNGHIIDAITYYGKAEDYEGILKVALFWPHASAEEGSLVLAIMDNAPKEVYSDTNLALLHARAHYFMGNITEYMNEFNAVIKKHEAMPKTPENLIALNELYVTVGVAFYYLTNYTNDLHFAKYIEDAYEYIKINNVSIKFGYSFQDVGTYVCRILSEKKEDMEAYVEAVKTAAYCVHEIAPGCMRGMYELTLTELHYFKNSMKLAEKSAYLALHMAREHNQHAIAFRAIFYLLRISLAEGSYSKIQSCIKQLDMQLEIENSPIYKTLYDIAVGWFYSIIGQRDKAASWIKGNSENVELNSIAQGSEILTKVKYYLSEKKYYELLGFLELQENVSDIRSFLLGKIAIGVVKSICLYHIDQKDAALSALQEAYILASPNTLTMHFIELGNDMVALTKFALKEGNCTIPKEWLKSIQMKSSTYAKRLSQVSAEYKKTNYSGSEVHINLTKKELELLNDIFRGLTRAEMAENYGLSPNYIKNRIQSIYAKLGAENTNDAIRIALLKQLIK